MVVNFRDEPTEVPIERILEPVLVLGEVEVADDASASARTARWPPARPHAHALARRAPSAGQSLREATRPSTASCEVDRRVQR